jgi:hypothetical protein
MEWKWTWPDLDVSPRLLETIRSLPVYRSVAHCGETFQISPFDIYADCPRCGIHFKVRSFAGVTELEDVFDAVFEWMSRPGAEELVRRRQQVIQQDQD